jgi:DNA-binding NtrC family response regulator
VSSGSRILLADDEPKCSEVLAEVLVRDGHRVTVAPDGARAREELLAQGSLDLLIAELAVPGVDGFELLQVARQAFPGLPVILMSEFGTVETAVTALRRGAFHYFQKPLDMDVVRATVNEALSARAAVADLPFQAPRTRVVDPAPADDLGIVGRGPWYERSLALVRRVAPARATVLLTGESGTGKELFARAIHRLSGRPGPFVAVSCAALPRDLLESELFGHEKGAFTGAERQRLGRFELAHTGTLLLEREFERIGGTQTVKVDVRIIASTNRDLAAAAREKTFREDLLYRLKVVEIALPPLRERREDVDLLARHFAVRYAEDNGRITLDIPSPVLRALRSYPWPGNTRELENCIERAVVLADPNATEIDLSLLPEVICQAGAEAARGQGDSATGGQSQASLPLERVEDDTRLRAFREALAATDGNAVVAARILGVTPRSVRYYADRYGIPRKTR